MIFDDIILGYFSVLFHDIIRSWLLQFWPQRHWFIVCWLHMLAVCQRHLFTVCFCDIVITSLFECSSSLSDFSEYCLHVTFFMLDWLQPLDWFFLSLLFDFFDIVSFNRINIQHVQTITLCLLHIQVYHPGSNL